MKPLSRVLSLRLVKTGLALCATSAIGCSDGTDGTLTGSLQGFVVQAGAATLSLPQNGIVSTPIKATRVGGMSGAITFTVTGTGAAGLTASVVSTSVPDSVVLTVSASASVVPATYPIVVHATASGVAEQQVSIAVTVTAAQATAPLIDFIATGAHSCAIASTGAAYCWGYNATGALGNNDTTIANPIPVAVSGGLTFQSISVSKVEGITCGLTTNGAAYCWGSNNGGQVGDGTKTRRLVPTAVNGGLSFKSIAVGNAHVCAIANNGTAYCWGTTPNGAFGDNTIGERLTPTVSVPGMTFSSVVSGSDFSCALTPSGAAYCWGLGNLGQLGDGNAATSRTPVAVSGALTFRSIVAAGATVCGLTTNGAAYCWGNNAYGQIGDGSDPLLSGNMRRSTPVAVAGNLTFASMSAGYATMCGVTEAGAGYCWGYNASGGVGDGQLELRPSPVAVTGGLTFRSIASGNAYGCGISTARAVFCWGANDDGELGNGAFSGNPTTSPVAVRWSVPANAALH